jgi:hypothetical protein
MRRFLALVVLAFCVMTEANLLAQQTTGIPPLSSVAGGPDIISLADNSLHFSVPIFARPGRKNHFRYQ